jgi:hypothetical protein
MRNAAPDSRTSSRATYGRTFPIGTRTWTSSARPCRHRHDATTGATPAILTTHTPRNVAFYERAGFAVDEASDVSLMGDAPYPLWGMRQATTVRSARTRARVRHHSLMETSTSLAKGTER